MWRASRTLGFALHSPSARGADRAGRHRRSGNTRRVVVPVPRWAGVWFMATCTTNATDSAEQLVYFPKIDDVPPRARALDMTLRGGESQSEGGEEGHTGICPSRPSACSLVSRGGGTSSAGMGSLRSSPRSAVLGVLETPDRVAERPTPAVLSGVIAGRSWCPDPTIRHEAPSPPPPAGSRRRAWPGCCGPGSGPLPPTRCWRQRST